MAETIIFKGNLIKCNRIAKEFKGQKGKEKLYVTLSDVALTDEQTKTIKDAFKESGKKFTPEWVQEFEGYVNLSTVYELPYKDTVNNTEGDSIEKYISDGFNWLGAVVLISANVKDGAIYPKAILIKEEGTPYNPFADFDKYDNE